MPPNPTRFKFDLRGVESGRQVLPGGVYIGKITSADITQPDGKEERIELVITVRGKYGKDDKVHDYTLYEYVHTSSESSQNWKLRELLEAVGIIKPGKEAGTADLKKDLLGKSIGVRTVIRAATEQYDESARVRRMFPPDADEVAEAKGEVEDLDESEDGAEAEAEETPYDDFTLGQLRKEARERGIKTVGMKADDIIDALLADDEAQEAETPEAEEEEEPEAEVIDVSALSLAEVKKLAREHGIKTVGKKPGELRAELQAAIAEAEPEEEEEPEEEAAEEEEEAAEEEAADDYDEWPIEDLRTEAKDRSLSERGGKGVLIARLRRDDAEGDSPF